MSKPIVKGQLKKAAKHSGIYAVGSLLSSVTGFVMLPIYTQYLTPADYGTVALLTMAVSIVGILVGLRISQALFRYYVMEEDEKVKKTIVSTVLFTVIIAGGIGVASLYSAAAPMSLIIFGSHEHVHELQLFSFTLLLSAIISTCLSYIRAREQPILFVTISAVYLAVQVFFNVIFVVVMELHVIGVIYSALVSGALMAAFLFLFTVTNVGVRYSRIIAKKLILFTAPLMLASLGAFLVSSMDKYLLRVFGSLLEVGLFVLAYRLASIVEMVFGAFNMTWAAMRYDVVKQDDAREIFDVTFRYVFSLLFIVGAGVAIFAHDILWVMATPAFYDAGGIVPILVLAFIVRAMSVFNNFGIHLKERTRHIAEGAWLKAIVSVFFFIVLIPLLGVYGAAIGVLIGNVVELRWFSMKSKNLYDMELCWSSMSIVGLVTIIFTLTGISLPTNDILYLTVRIAIFIVMVYIIYALPIWSNAERAAAISVVRGRLSFMRK